MKVRDAITNWPVKRWAAEDARQVSLPLVDSSALKLRWFSTPDDEGWFRVVATDTEQNDWATFCRVHDVTIWPALESTLSAQLRANVEEIGALEIERT
jgi:hypothetical protein